MSLLTSSYPVPSNEAQRLAALQSYRLLDTAPEPAYDEFVQLASFICDTPIALITLIDEDRQWFKANLGMEGSETPREQAFCAHTIMGERPLIVEDARQDARFADNPSVTGGPQIRFYAGAPLTTSDGYNLGSLCVIDRQPRQLSELQQAALEALAHRVVAQFELRRTSQELAEALESVRTLSGLLPMCSYCKQIRNDEGYWRSVEHYISTQTEARLSHGICPDCLQANFPDYCEEQEESTPV